MDQDDMIFMQSMRFCPTDAELIGYLDRRIAGSLPASDHLIFNADICATEPWNLPRGSPWWKKGEGYYFTPRRMRSSNGKGCNVVRAFKGGVWKANGTPRRICDSKKNQVGLKTTLMFLVSGKKSRQEVKTDWCMHEYILHSSTNKFQDMAICRIYNKKSNKDDSGESVSQAVPEASDTKQEEAIGESFSQPLGSWRCQVFPEASDINQQEAIGESFSLLLGRSTSQVIPESADTRQEEAFDEWFSLPLSSWWSEYIVPQASDTMHEKKALWDPPADQIYQEECEQWDPCSSSIRKRKWVSQDLKTDDIQATGPAAGGDSTIPSCDDDSYINRSEVMWWPPQESMEQRNRPSDLM